MTKCKKCRAVVWGRFLYCDLCLKDFEIEEKKRLKEKEAEEKARTNTEIINHINEQKEEAKEAAKKLVEIIDEDNSDATKMYVLLKTLVNSRRDEYHIGSDGFHELVERIHHQDDPIDVLLLKIYKKDKKLFHKIHKTYSDKIKKFDRNEKIITTIVIAFGIFLFLYFLSF